MFFFLSIQIKSEVLSDSILSSIQEPNFIPADVTNEENVQTMLTQIKEKYGRLDALINCAGIGVAFRTYNINKVI